MKTVQRFVTTWLTQDGLTPSAALDLQAHTTLPTPHIEGIPADVSLLKLIYCRTFDELNIPITYRGKKQAKDRAVTIWSTFSVFYRCLFKLTVIYYKSASYYLILKFLCMENEMVEWRWKISVIIYYYLQGKLSVRKEVFVFMQCVIPSDHLLYHALIQLCWV